MEKPNEIVLVSFDDWEGLYLNGKNQAEGHTIPDKEEFLAQHQPFTYRRDEGDDEWAIEQGWLPKDLSEVKVIRRGRTYP